MAADLTDRSFVWDRAADTDRAMEGLEQTLFGHLPGHVMLEDGRRAKAQDLSKLQQQLSEALSNSDGFNLVGYSAVFNQWTQIDDHTGRYMEQLAPGAFKKTLRERGNRVKVMYDHGTSSRYGKMSIASVRAQWEDEHGLFAWDRLHESEFWEPLRENLRTGMLNGQSFRFYVTDEKRQPGTADSLEMRTITGVSLIERGPVEFPAYEGTSVALRDAGGTVGDTHRPAGATGEAPVDSGPAGVTLVERRLWAARLAGVTHDAGPDAGRAGSVAGEAQR